MYETVDRITERLRFEGIDHAVFSEVALAAHGFKQFTSTIEIIVGRDSPAAVQDRLAGDGFTRVTATRLRADVTSVEIRFITADLQPDDVIEIHGRRVVRLEKIIELKLVFGLAAAPQRLFDLGLVQKVIEHLNLPLDLAEKLDPSVRDTYIEYWHGNQNATGPDRA